MNFQNEFTYLCALRGATTCENNSVESITSADGQRSGDAGNDVLRRVAA